MFSTQNIKASDVVEVESALRALIRSEFPEISAERGSSLGDLVISSLAYLAAAVKAEADQVNKRLYLADLTSSDDSDSIALLEDLASNFLVSLEDMPPKRGLVTFRFKTDIPRTLPADITLTRGDNFITLKLFDSSQDVLIDSDSYIPVTIDGAQFFDYPTLMESVRVADEVTIGPGLFQSSTTLVDLESVFNNSPFVGTAFTDYNQLSLVGRMEYAQTFRSFATQRGIQAVLLNEGIPNLLRSVGVGAQDPEMQRDIIPRDLSSSSFHSLGMINVVLASRLYQESMPIAAGDTAIGGKPIVGILSASGPSGDLALVSDFGNLRYTKVYDSQSGATSITVSHDGGAALPPNSMVATVTSNSALSLVNGSSDTSKFDISYPANSAEASTLRVLVDNNVPVVQGLIDSDRYSALASSVKAMAAIAIQVLVPNLRLGLAPGIAATALSAGRVRSVISEYIGTWSAEYPISISGLHAHLAVVFSGLVTTIEFVGGVNYIVYLPDGRFIGYTTSEALGVEDDTLQIEASGVVYEDTLLPLQASNRVLNYYVTSDDISVEVVDV
jgi:hypothetical protein